MVRSDRGQLILVGAIAIALILLGLVLIVNTALFTQVVGSEGTVESAKEGGVSGQEIGNAIGAVVAEENRKSGTPSVDTSNLEPVFVNRSVDGSGSYVSLSYISSKHTGSIVQQRSVDDFTDNTDSGGWSPVDSSERGEIGEFVVTVRTDQGSGGDFDIELDNGTGPRTLNVNVNPGANEVSVDAPGRTPCNGIGSTNDTVRIDVKHGTVYEDGNCQFEAINRGDRYSIGFNGDLSEIHGTYDIVVNSSVSDNFRYSGSDGPDKRVAVWSFEYRFTYDTVDSTVKSDRREVDVYD